MLKNSYKIIISLLLVIQLFVQPIVVSQNQNYNTLIATQSSNNSIGYTGQRLDNETGLMALGNGERYYSPSYARFIQQDSFAGMPMMPQSLNRFSYAHNNPNKFTDPSGNFVFAFIILPFLIGVGISVVVQDQQIKAGTRKQEDFSLSEAAVDYTVIGSTFRAASGMDAVSGKQLTGGEQAFAVLETALEFTSIVGNTAGLLAKSARAASAARVIGNTAEATQAAIGIYRGGNTTLDLIEQGSYSHATLTAILTAFGGYGGAKAYKGLKAELPNWKLFPPGVGIDGIGVPSVKFVGGKGEDYYFRGTTYKRGTTEIYEGNPNVVAERGISVSDNPAKASNFAARGRDLGEPVLLVAPKSKFAKTERLEANYYRELEEETVLNMTAKQFYSKATHKIPLDKARTILKDMGIDVPHRIEPQDLTYWLKEMPNMPQSLNRFSYGYNNPLSYTDSSGNSPDELNENGY